MATMVDLETSRSSVAAVGTVWNAVTTGRTR